MTTYTNKGHIRNCDNAKLESMLADCIARGTHMDNLVAARIREELAARGVK